MLNINQTYQTKKYFYSKVNTCQYVVLHHTGPGKGIDIVKYLATNPKEVSCHYVVDIDGTIYQLASDDKCTRHAGVSKREGKTDLNLYSIGIEIVGDHSFTDVQRQAVHELVASLIAKYKIGNDRIIRHKDIAPGRKVDVHDNFRNGDYATREDYQKSYSANFTTQNPEAMEAKNLGIRNGLDPQRPATREEVAIMILRATKL